MAKTKIDRDELIERIYLKYGTGIILTEYGLKEFNMNSPYSFRVNKVLNKYPKEFTMEIKDILYRNYYWIDTPYRTSEIYSNLKMSKSMIKQSLNPEKRYGIDILMDDGYQFKFVPDYIDKKNKEFFHYFDMSYFTCPGSPREIFLKIIREFSLEEEWTLNCVMAKSFQKDYN